MDTPLRLYLFVLLLCSFLNQVLPSSVSVCSGQDTHLQDTPRGRAPGRGRQVAACALGSTGSSAMGLSSSGSGG